MIGTKNIPRPRNFADVSGGRENNFDFLRFCFASLVIFSHSFELLFAPGTLPSFDPLLRFSKGQFAFGGGSVASFFLISGFLISKSWIFSKGTWDYTKKRALRIIPALVVLILFNVFIVGPLAVDNLHAYFHNPQTYKYLGLMFSTDIDRADVLPGVFVHNPHPERVDGSLWTIRYEAICYVMVAILGLIGVYKKPKLLLVLFSATYALKAYMVSGHHLTIGGHSLDVFDNLVNLLMYFTVGMLFHFFSDKIPYSPKLFWLSILVLLVSGKLGSNDFKLMQLTLPICGAYVLFYVAFIQGLKISKFAKYGDFSYGIYLYAFPVQQLLAHFFPHALNPTTMFFSAWAISFVLAVLSWKLIEQPFMKLKGKRSPVRPELTPAPHAGTGLQADAAELATRVP